jgi:hypothetical protein
MDNSNATTRNGCCAKQVCPNLSLHFGKANSRVLKARGTNTYQAYNDWGGQSFYDSGFYHRKGQMVSFDRPTPPYSFSGGKTSRTVRFATLTYGLDSRSCQTVPRHRSRLPRSRCDGSIRLALRQACRRRGSAVLAPSISVQGMTT